MSVKGKKSMNMQRANWTIELVGVGRVWTSGACSYCCSHEPSECLCKWNSTFCRSKWKNILGFAFSQLRRFTHPITWWEDIPPWVLILFMSSIHFCNLLFGLCFFNYFLKTLARDTRIINKKIIPTILFDSILKFQTWTVST